MNATNPRPAVGGRLPLSAVTAGWLPRLSQSGLMTYTVLAAHADWRTGECHLKTSTIGTLIGRSERTVRDALAMLQACGLIVADRRGGKGRASQFTVVAEPPAPPTQDLKGGSPGLPRLGAEGGSPELPRLGFKGGNSGARKVAEIELKGGSPGLPPNKRTTLNTSPLPPTDIGEQGLSESPRLGGRSDAEATTEQTNTSALVTRMQRFGIATADRVVAECGETADVIGQVLDQARAAGLSAGGVVQLLRSGGARDWLAAQEPEDGGKAAAEQERQRRRQAEHDGAETVQAERAATLKDFEALSPQQQNEVLAKAAQRVAKLTGRRVTAAPDGWRTFPLWANTVGIVLRENHHCRDLLQISVGSSVECTKPRPAQRTFASAV
jgi:hypothetical protein